MSAITRCLVHSSAILASVALAATSARADRVTVEVGGAVAVEASAHLHVEVAQPVLRHLHDFAVHAAAGWELGIDFAEPPPPPPCYDPCAVVVPSYYVEPPPPPEVYYVDRQQPIPESRPRRHRFGVGVFAGSVDVDDQEVGSDLGILARYRLTRGLSFEAEVARSEIRNVGRTDRRFGAALLYDFVPSRTLSPFILAGAGFGQTEIDDRELRARQAYGEVGAGLTYRINRRFQIVGDARLGKRDTADDVVALMTPGADAVIQEKEDYSRFRLGALLFF